MLQIQWDLFLREKIDQTYQIIFPLVNCCCLLLQQQQPEWPKSGNTSNFRFYFGFYGQLQIWRKEKNNFSLTFFSKDIWINILKKYMSFNEKWIFRKVRFYDTIHSKNGEMMVQENFWTLKSFCRYSRIWKKGAWFKQITSLMQQTKLIAVLWVYFLTKL